MRVNPLVSRFRPLAFQPRASVLELSAQIIEGGLPRTTQQEPVKTTFSMRISRLYPLLEFNGSFSSKAIPVAEKLL